VMSAVRLARAVTGRSAIVKFDGSGPTQAARLGRSGVATLGLPDSRACLASGPTRWLRLQDPDAVERLFAPGARYCAVLVEGGRGQHGSGSPEPGFLRLRGPNATARFLVFDES